MIVVTAFLNTIFAMDALIALMGRMKSSNIVHRKFVHFLKHNFDGGQIVQKQFIQFILCFYSFIIFIVLVQTELVYQRNLNVMVWWTVKTNQMKVIWKNRTLSEVSDYILAPGICGTSARPCAHARLSKHFEYPWITLILYTYGN